jgi:cyclophilin family peptidyl-prolyl cis-trans isomerase
MSFGLFAKANFLQIMIFCRKLCLGTNGYGYKGSKIFRALPNNHIVGGDFEKNNGSGGYSAMQEGKLFVAEPCPLGDQKGNLNQ